MGRIFERMYTIETSPDCVYNGSMTFAEKLRTLRDSLNLSEVRLARKAGVPVGTLHGYGLGQRHPSLAAAAKIARALGVSLDVFADCSDVDPVDKRPSSDQSAPKHGRPPRPRAEG